MTISCIRSTGTIYISLLFLDAQQNYANLKQRFRNLLIATRIATERMHMGISVDDLVDKVVGVCRACDNDYIMEYSDQLRRSGSVASVYDRLHCRWDYLHPDVYVHLIREIPLHLEKEAKAYQEQLARFLEQTLLTTFCKIPRIEEESDTSMKLPPEFTEFITTHRWDPPYKYLDDVEELRMRLANKCSLQSCIVTIKLIMKGSIVITMFVPESTEIRNVAMDLEFIRKYSITRMVFKGVVVYSQVSQELSSSAYIYVPLSPYAVVCTFLEHRNYHSLYCWPEIVVCGRVYNVESV